MMRSTQCPLLIGRDGEMQALTVALDETSAGRGGAVFVTGDLGVGKSRLAREVAQLASSRGFEVVTGRAVESAVPVPYRPIAEALMRLARSGQVPGAPDLADYRPALGSLVMSAQVPPGELLLRPMLVTAAQVTGGVALPAGMIAVSVNLCLPEAVAENIGPGAEVEVLDTFAPGTSSLSAQPNCTGPHQQQANGNARTRVILPRVQVLSVGIAAGAGHGASSTSTSAFPASTTGGPSSASSQAGNVLVTLAVTQADALRLIQITETGLPYLALLQH